MRYVTNSFKKTQILRLHCVENHNFKLKIKLKIWIAVSLYKKRKYNVFLTFFYVYFEYFWPNKEQDHNE